MVGVQRLPEQFAAPSLRLHYPVTFLANASSGFDGNRK